MDNLALELIKSNDQEISKIINQATEKDFINLIKSSNQEVFDKILKTLDHQSLDRIFSIIDINTIRKKILESSKSAITNLTKIINYEQLSKLIRNASEEFIKKFIDSTISKESRHFIISKLPYEEQDKWFKYVQKQENIMFEIIKTADDYSQLRWDEQKKLLNNLEENIRSKEKALRRFEDDEKIKLKHLESISKEAEKRLIDLQDNIKKQEDEIQIRELDLEKRIKEFEILTSKQVQQRIESKVPEYVTETVNILDKKEAHYRKKAMLWSIQGLVILVFAISGTIWISLYGYSYGEELSNLAWQSLLFISFKGLVVLGVLGLWAKHAFIVSNAYTHEAIKRADRAHAINFGKLYLEIYGNSIDRKELIDIFENWNIATESAFSKIKTDGFEPKLLDKILEAIKITDRNK
ncbi:hypothetical protein MID00_20180 [Alcaligenes sp. NLF5-7]|uniref:hypothetical protein n=1 Tax=Alcaligenes sp. NLF5-7 TaxID=2918755 RepID=UPI0020C5688A|nr:hypothetical protein [Alcaligenes sp. NLF5-7]UTM01769.1 hypothetical protein MID00_20180 [Alcaligenes sp. NLF5-7]